MILSFDCDQFILRTIDNCAPFVEKIYISYSPEPWLYNKQARRYFKNTSDLNLLKKSTYFDQLEIVEGVWDNEENQRNACLQRARADGYEYLIVQDADEFYLMEDYKNNIAGILNNPGYSYYRTPWICFWKSLEYVLEFRDPGFGEKNTIYARCPNFAVKVDADIEFRGKRVINKSDFFLLPGLCYHLSYVLSDEEVFRKISTWGHSHQVDITKWYKWKWLAWNSETKYVYPTQPAAVNRAVRYQGPIPKEIKDFVSNHQNKLKLTWNEQMQSRLEDLNSIIKFNFLRVKLLLISYFK